MRDIVDKNILKLQNIGEQKIVESLEETQIKAQNNDVKKIFEPIKKAWDLKHKILFTILRETSEGNLTTYENVGKNLPTDYSEDSNARVATVSKEVNALNNSGHIFKLKSCPICGTKYKSIPEVCSNCRFKLLIHDEQDSNKNGNNKPPHWGLKLTQISLSEMDEYYFSLKNYGSEYEKYRGRSLCHKIRRNITSLSAFSWSIIRDRKSDHSIIIEKISAVISDIKILKELGTRFNQDFEISYLERLIQRRARNLRYDQWRKLSENLEKLDSMISSLIPET